ncbi:MAG: class I SAM-dependent methyltransferase [Cypionkella sp.]
MTQDIFAGLVRNELGYWEVAQKPTEEGLQSYYASKYYQEGKGSYDIEYSAAEIDYFKAKIEQRWNVLKPVFDKPGSMLDVGCGEGYALAFFKELGWSVRGLDYSRAGLESKNGHCAADLVDGDVVQLLKNEQAASNSYDLIWLQNVLEHVIDPVALLNSLRQLVKPGGVLVVTVPNDFSQLQLRAISTDVVTRPYWVAPPDHLSYFSRDSLLAIGERTKWRSFEIIGDVPVDWFLFHRGSNYIEDKSVGKQAHRARVELENLIHKNHPDDVTAFFSALARIGMGRDLTAFFQPL